MKRVIAALSLLLLTCGTVQGYTMDVVEGDMIRTGSADWFVEVGAIRPAADTYVLEVDSEYGRSGSVEGSILLSTWMQRQVLQSPAGEWPSGGIDPFPIRLSINSSTTDNIFLEFAADEGQWDFTFPFAYDLDGSTYVDISMDVSMPQIVENGLAAYASYGYTATFALPEEVPPIPEPGTFLLLGSALAVFGGLRFRRRENG